MRATCAIMRENWHNMSIFTYIVLCMYLYGIRTCAWTIHTMSWACYCSAVLANGIISSKYPVQLNEANQRAVLSGGQKMYDKRRMFLWARMWRHVLGVVDLFYTRGGYVQRYVGNVDRCRCPIVSTDWHKEMATGVINQWGTGCSVTRPLCRGDIVHTVWNWCFYSETGVLGTRPGLALNRSAAVLCITLPFIQTTDTHSGSWGVIMLGIILPLGNRCE